MKFSCDDWFEKLYEYLDRDMDEGTWKNIEEHLQHCRSCWDRAEFERKLKERLKNSCCKEPCPDTLEKRIKEILEKY